MNMFPAIANDTLMDNLQQKIHNFFTRANWATSSTLDDLKNVFDYEAFYCSENMAMSDNVNLKLSEFAKVFLAGEEGAFESFKTELKSFDFSSTCGLVWTTNYFAYRCRTCSLSPSMSLCSNCFNNGNHVGHDFNKFKSQAGGACDCGNGNVMKDIGYCVHHGPSRLSEQLDPPQSLIWRLELLLPLYLRCILYSCWSLIKNTDIDENALNMATSLSGVPNNMSDVLVTPLSFINELLSCGLVVQKMVARIMIDELEYTNFMADIKDTDQYYVYQASLAADSSFKFPKDKIDSQVLHHTTLVDGFLFVCVKLRFPENLITFLIGLLTVDAYKEKFVYTFLNHYSRMASTILIHAKSVRNGQDYSYNMNNRIVHISVQLFSGEAIALKMVKERKLHYLIVHCLLNMFRTALTRLDTNDNYVINCETPMIQNNVFWPLISDLTNLVTHKSVVNYFISDLEFMKDWSQLLKIMQFMNFFVLKEGTHIEYETMAFFHAYTMEIEISSTSMWNIWYHYRGKEERDNTLKLVCIFVSCLNNYLKSLGKFRTTLTPHPTRPPLSFHLPLMRNVTCFISLGLVYHNIPLDCLMKDMGLHEMKRWFKETINTLLGCHEVLIGYWVRNGQSVRTSTTYYIHSQFCYALIDMDIFAAQICLTKIPGRQVIYVYADPNLLLKGIDFNYKCLAHTDYLPMSSSSPTNAIANSNNLPSNSSVYQPASTMNVPSIVSTVTLSTTSAVVPSINNTSGTIALAHQQRNSTDKMQIEKQPLALESWLLNLCWVLDLRNEMTTDDRAKLRREVCSELCTEPIKRSDLSHRLPEKTGIHIQISPDVDTILSEVSNFKSPTFDEHSGNLQSGLYAFKPELWDTDYDPLFQSLRSVTKRDAADALSKYRDFYRQKHNIPNANGLWPPYRIPASPHPEMKNLENLLHCRDLTYVVFCCLNMFVNNDPVVSEDSLALVIHLIRRSLQIPRPTTPLDDGLLTRYPNNPFKVNDAVYNLRCKVDLYESFPDVNPDVHVYENKGYQVDTDDELAEVTEVKMMESTARKYPESLFINPVQKESILSLLIKVHSKVHSLRLQSGGTSIVTAQSTKVYNSKCLKVPNTNKPTTNITVVPPISGNTTSEVNRLAHSAKILEEPMEINELNINIARSLSANSSTANASLENEVDQSNNQANQYQDSESNEINEHSDVDSLAYFIDYPLVYEYSEHNLTKSKQTGVGINWGDGVDFIGHLLDIISSQNDANSLELFQLVKTIREKFQENVVPSEQATNLDDPTRNDQPEQPSTTPDDQLAKPQSAMVLETLQEKKLKALDRRRRVIESMSKKQKDFADSHQIDLSRPDKADIGIGFKTPLYECVICQTKSDPKTEKMVLLGLLCSTEGLKFMYNNEKADNKMIAVRRGSYSNKLKLSLPVLSHGLIIQTCGHVVHQDCFDKYKTQRPAVTRMRRTVTCPLCRRDVHHLTPITGARPDKYPHRPTIMHEQHMNVKPSCSKYGSHQEIILSLLDSLAQVLFTLYGKPSTTFANHIIDDHLAKTQSTLLLTTNQSCCLLRSQIELEVMICLTYPDQYSVVSKRCNFPEFIAYIHGITTNIALIIKQIDLLFNTNFAENLPETERDKEALSKYFIFQSPTDLLLNFIPYIWPYEDWFKMILKSTLVFAYIKSLISISTRISPNNYNEWLMPISDTEDEFTRHLKLVVKKCRLINKSKQKTNIKPVTKGQNMLCEQSDESGTPAAIPIDNPLDKLVTHLLPTLRIAAVLKLRMISAATVPTDFPIQPFINEQDKFTEFNSLCAYLDLIQPTVNVPKTTSLSPNQIIMEKIQLLISNCLPATLYTDFKYVVNNLITPEFIAIYIREMAKEMGKNWEILNLGNELIAPRLIKLPECYDDLFNTYHLRKCTKHNKQATHNFPENGLCLICGKLFCLICESMPLAFSEHANSCCFGVGLIIDINTSIIHVLLSNEISQWGSVYLDSYGEEDLELKRGRPLYINASRMVLLEQQWLSHSFKHVVKTWRRTS